MSHVTCRGCGSPLADGQSGPCPICGDSIGNISVSPAEALVWEDAVIAKSWGMASFGEAWFADALNAAREGQGRDAMRLKILTCLLPPKA